MNILIFAASGVLIFFAFRLLNGMGKTLLTNKAFRTVTLTFLPLAELVAWVAYTFWGAMVLFGGHIYYDLIVSIMAVLLIIGIAWFFFRDFLAGVLLKAEKALEPGKLIKTPFAEGRIKKLGLRALELVNEAGENVKIPYSKLSNEHFILPADNEDNLPNHLLVTIPENKVPTEVREMVLKNLQAMPWIVNPQPRADIVKTAGDAYALKLSFHTHLRAHAVVVEDKVRSLVG